MTKFDVLIYFTYLCISKRLGIVTFTHHKKMIIASYDGCAHVSITWAFVI